MSKEWRDNLEVEKKKKKKYVQASERTTTDVTRIRDVKTQDEAREICITGQP